MSEIQLWIGCNTEGRIIAGCVAGPATTRENAIERADMQGLTVRLVDGPVRLGDQGSSYPAALASAPEERP